MVAVLQYGTVMQCCNHGTVHATATLYEPGAGGILSSMSSEESYNMIATLSDCYNDGIVTCGYKATASYLHGYLKGITGVSGPGNVIQNCYNVGTLQSTAGSVEIGGLFKVWGGTTYTSTGCYVTALHRSTTGGTLMTDVQSKQQTTYVGYDFTNVWAIDASVNGGRPYLKTLPLPTDSRWYSGPQELVPVSGVVLDQESVSLHIGENGKLTATVKPNDATDPSVRWNSSDPTVVTVTQDGNIVTHSPGTATITVTTLDGNYQATCQITVTDHRYQETVIHSTCTDVGYTRFTCTICEDSHDENHTPTLGHNFDTIITAPTCTEKGFTTYICTRCKYSYNDHYTNLMGHIYTAVITAPLARRKDLPPIPAVAGTAMWIPMFPQRNTVMASGRLFSKRPVQPMDLNAGIAQTAITSKRERLAPWDMIRSNTPPKRRHVLKLDGMHI